MRRPIIIFTIVCGGAWLPTTVAVAQNMGGTYSNYTYTPPVVSPYLNLTMNANGLSNYQSLVKPMLDEQDVLVLAIGQIYRNCSSNLPGRSAAPGPRTQAGARHRVASGRPDAS